MQGEWRTVGRGSQAEPGRHARWLAQCRGAGEAWGVPGEEGGQRWHGAGSSDSELGTHTAVGLRKQGDGRAATEGQL